MGAFPGASLPAAAGMAWLVSSSAGAALLLAIAWLSAALLRRSTPAARHRIWALGVAGALVLPLLAAVLPALSLQLPAIGARGPLPAGAIVVTVTDGAASAAGPAWPALLALAWVAGGLLVSLRFLRGHLAARRLLRASGAAGADAWRSALEDAARSLGVRGGIDLRRSEVIGAPVTVGVLRPRILLPAAADGWPAERLHAVLLHELGHVRRHDTLVQLAAQAACALYWWNPLAWLAARRLRDERELACDDLVLAAGTRPSSYAEDLLAVARFVASGAPAPACAIGAAGPSWTEARLRRILDPTARRQSPTAPFRLLASGTALALVVTLACASAPPASPTPDARTARATAPGAPPAPAAWEDGLDAYERPTFDPTAPGAPARPAEELDPAFVAHEVQLGLGDVNECFPRRLLEAAAPSGLLRIHWAINGAGRTVESCVTQDTLGDDAARACVSDHIAKGRFPALGGRSVEVSFPLRR